MRLLSQPLAMLANQQEKLSGRFWQGRYRAVRLCDETALLACAAYVDLNPIRAALAETIETSDFISVQRRIQSLSVEEWFRHSLSDMVHCLGIVDARAERAAILRQLFALRKELAEMRADMYRRSAEHDT